MPSENESHLDSNPFAAPQVQTDYLPTPTTLKPKHPLRTLFKWTLVCGISAAPSFFWGGVVGEMQVFQIVAMICGICTFIAGYTLAEYTAFAKNMNAQPLVRRTLRIGYGTRIAISILFPVGLFLDMYIGMFSIQTTQLILSINIGQSGADLVTFIGFYVTTLIQGVYLNIGLACYMLVVHRIVIMTHNRRLPAA
ncbi:MAG: hypothetical protein AB8B50_16930 [Pirellulaceae bacterium]